MRKPRTGKSFIPGSNSVVREEARLQICDGTLALLRRVDVQCVLPAIWGQITVKTLIPEHLGTRQIQNISHKHSAEFPGKEEKSLGIIQEKRGDIQVETQEEDECVDYCLASNRQTSELP